MDQELCGSIRIRFDESTNPMCVVIQVLNRQSVVFAANEIEAKELAERQVVLLTRVALNNVT